jgi:hypothetical protein
MNNCPHFAGEVIGTRLPPRPSYVATWCPQCGVWIRRTDPIVPRTPNAIAPPVRRMGFTHLPVRCSHCDRRLEQPPQLVHGMVMRCDGCFQLQYVWFAPQVQLAFAVDVQMHEVTDMAARALNVRDVLRELGAMREVA